jgi:hypothetical protein
LKVFSNFCSAAFEAEVVWDYFLRLELDLQKPLIFANSDVVKILMDGDDIWFFFCFFWGVFDKLFSGWQKSRFYPLSPHVGVVLR